MQAVIGFLSLVDNLLVRIPKKSEKTIKDVLPYNRVHIPLPLSGAAGGVKAVPWEHLKCALNAQLHRQDHLIQMQNGEMSHLLWGIISFINCFAQSPQHRLACKKLVPSHTQVSLWAFWYHHVILECCLHSYGLIKIVNSFLRHP